MPTLLEVVSMVTGQVVRTVPIPDADLSGKTIIVTGANSGLGLEACRRLLHLNVSHLILACRDIDKGTAAKQDILSSHPYSTATIDVWPIDMASFSSVTAFAARCVSSLPRLDAVIANAGIEVKHFALAEGVEQTLTVNVLSTFLLGLLLVPKLQRTGQQQGVETYFSVVGSAIQIFAPREQLLNPNGELFKALSDPQTADMQNRYYLSKLLDTICTRALARHTPAKVIVNCVSPGFCDTALYSRFQPPMYTRVLLRLIGISAEQGSRCLVWGILGGRESHGQFMSEGRVRDVPAWVSGKMEEGVWSEVLAVLEGVRPGIGNGLRI